MKFKSLPLSFVIKKASLEEMDSYAKLRLVLDAETEFIRLSPEEKKLILKKQPIAKDLLLLGFIEQEAIAFLEASFDLASKKIYSVQLGVLKTHMGFGIGSQLFSELEKWAQDIGAKIIELKVMTHNVVALEMYQRRNFVVGETSHFKLYGSDQNVSDYKLTKTL